MRRTAVEILIVSCCAAIVAPAWAHHSMVAYGTKTITVEGMVTDVKWRNPHMSVTVAAPDADGKTKSWTMEGGGVTAAIASGVSPKVLKVGTHVKISGRRHLDLTKNMMLLGEVEIDGKVYGRNQQIDRPRVSQR